MGKLGLCGTVDGDHPPGTRSGNSSLSGSSPPHLLSHRVGASAHWVNFAILGTGQEGQRIRGSGIAWGSWGNVWGQGPPITIFHDETGVANIILSIIEELNMPNN